MFLRRFSVWEGETVFFWGGAELLQRFSVWEGETVSFFFFWGGGGGAPVFLQRFREGETVSLFFFWGGAGGGGAERRCFFFTDLVFGRGKLCPFFFFLGGGGRAPVFLQRFSVWEGETVSFFFFWGGGRGAERRCFFRDLVFGRGKLCPFFFWRGVGRSAGVSSEI